MRWFIFTLTTAWRGRSQRAYAVGSTPKKSQVGDGSSAVGVAGAAQGGVSTARTMLFSEESCIVAEHLTSRVFLFFRRPDIAPGGVEIYICHGRSFRRHMASTADLTSDVCTLELSWR